MGFRFGHSKDHGDDLPQIVIAGRDQGNHPVRCWCLPGNTNDANVLAEVRIGMRGSKLAGS
jgi:transposase